MGGLILGGYETFKIDSVRPGDILFTARPGTSKAIRIATHGIVSHAMICVQHGSFIDSTMDGVQARNLQRELFEDDEKAFHFRLKEPVAPEVLSNVIDYARAEIGARYSLSEAIRSVRGAHKPGSKCQFCSRLVATVYKRAGIDLVPNTDYCSPEDLRRSPLLVEVPVETEIVSPEEVEWSKDRGNSINAMHIAQNAVLAAARTVDPNVENFNDLYSLLVNRPDADQVMATALRDSGYLDLWRMEVALYPWRYDLGLIDQMTESHEDLREYCIGTIKEAYSGGVRFSVNLIQLQALSRDYPRESLRLKIELYKILVHNDQRRREVAYAWLSEHYPDDLKHHMEQIEPHSPYWYSIVDRVEPTLAALSRRNVEREGRPDVCSSCGDRPALDYRLINGVETMPGVPSLRLCDDCIDIRRGMGNVLASFLVAE
ncbi:YiiX/YebB-like N1pC/P60 family cysteine hydrolase [Mesorhizobium sp. VK25A]|uniref:YiiX/YebB-like N1pC/P60 family cysteine hydrolase n=1 Tax=Mesorhizobium vachelliae TaxID=3072309 RepID=UPI002A244F2B|nr:YiiX/YebB-like N1pC/P60 family cysteine hydrolase [Mesorhizobium sp. VK25A]MDX8548031.1 YiiX/YebB-like N1pC/P60 family cysteine hydrolase [Mesorhizobium sp. VK25A]